ncbi:hypothetical protein GCM10017673_34280 [Streptosporangium violaceochromogenes]|nr:hypothetical protein GCM10017673_34280 [Streptosporangium violaceochromogenes]
MSDGERVRVTPRNQEWLLALLPAFPLVLLVTRLWYASEQDTQTLLLLVQSISPLGMLTAVLLTTVWVLPALVLGGRVLGTLYWVSARRSSWLVRAAERLPGWVVLLAVALGAFSWQLRFLPTLAMLSLSAAGLVVRDRFPLHEGLRAVVCYALPAVAAALSYTLLWPALVGALAAGDTATLILLVLPPAAAILLTGPVPEASARVLTHGIAVAITIFTPFLVGVVVMNAPILPLTALQVDEDRSSRVLVGYLVASDDQMSTFLEREGTVSFIRTDTIQSRVLCPDPGAVPRTWVNLHGWYAEQSVISWLAPGRSAVAVDPRCQGRSG